MNSLKRKFEQTKGKGNGKGNGNGKGKGKGNRRGQAQRTFHVPPAVQEMEDRNYLTKCRGDPICFRFNLPGGCADAAPGQKCPRGWHVCAHRQCKDKREAHTASTH